MPNQLINFQHMLQADQSRAKVIAVASGKGGVGKTNISTNLSICLASAGKKTLLIDADFSLGNVDVLLNINSKYNFSHVMNGLKTIEQIKYIGPMGVEIICGTCGLERLADMSQFERQRVIHQLQTLQKDADYIIIDAAAGIGKSVSSLCLASDQVLVITTPEPTAITDAYALIKIMSGNNYKGTISLIVNMADSIAQGKKIFQQIAKVARRFLNVNIHEAAILLNDDKVKLAVKTRKAAVLAYPRAQISLSITALSVKLSTGSPVNNSKNGFFRKVADLFF